MMSYFGNDCLEMRRFALTLAVLILILGFEKSRLRRRNLNLIGSFDASFTLFPDYCPTRMVNLDEKPPLSRGVDVASCMIDLRAEL